MSDASGRAVEISTGQTVRLPLSTTATMAGAVFSVAADAAAHLVPDRLEPLSVTPARTALLLVSVEYHRIDRNQLTPYDEFGMFLPVVPASASGWLSALRGGLGGYTWQLPVTTEPARALGDIWGFPKTVADIDLADDGRRRRTTVAVDGQRVLSLDVKRPRAVPVSYAARSYTDGGEAVHAVPVRVDGTGSVAPGYNSGAVELGDHPWADQLRVLGVESIPLAVCAFEGEFVIDEPDSVESA